MIYLCYYVEIRSNCSFTPFLFIIYHLSLSFIIVYENFVTENYIIYERTIRQNACIKLNSMYLLISRYL